MNLLSDKPLLSHSIFWLVKNEPITYFELPFPITYISVLLLKMDYDIPLLCPILSPRLCFFSYLCPCYVASVIYARLFTDRKFSVFGLILLPFSAYYIRRFVVERMQYEETTECSAVKSCVCCCSSLTQSVNEMRVRGIGVYKYDAEPDLEESSSEGV